MKLPYQALRLHLAPTSISLLLAFLVLVTSSPAQAALPAGPLGQSLDSVAVLLALLGAGSLAWLRCHGRDPVSPRRIEGRI